MTADPLGVDPSRVEPRGEFPTHGPGPNRVRVLTRDEALARALRRLAEWRKDHPHGH